MRDFAVSEEVLPGTPEPAGTQGRSRNCAEDTCHRGAVIDRRSEERGAVRRQGSFRNTVPAADAPSSSACSSLRAELAFGSVRRSSAPAHTLPSRNGNQQSSVSKISGRFRAPGAVLEDLSSGRPNGPNPLTKSQLEFLLDPTRLFRDSAAPKNENCFVGPLNEIFSNGKITKPGRSVPPGSSEWAAGVTECSRWWYPAEDSGASPGK